MLYDATGYVGQVASAVVVDQQCVDVWWLAVDLCHAAQLQCQVNDVCLDDEPQKVIGVVKAVDNVWRDVSMTEVILQLRVRQCSTFINASATEQLVECILQRTTFDWTVVTVWYRDLNEESVTNMLAVRFDLKWIGQFGKFLEFYWELWSCYWAHTSMTTLSLWSNHLDATGLLPKASTEVLMLHYQMAIDSPGGATWNSEMSELGYYRHVQHTLALVCVKSHRIIFCSLLDIRENVLLDIPKNVEWPRFFDHPV